MDFLDKENNQLKVEKLVIGKTYYIPQRGCPTNYASGVLVEIVSKNKVILENKKGNRFSCNTNKLHKAPDKAVRGRKAQERVRREMNELKRKERENLVDKEIQAKIKKLGHSTYATIDQNKYVVIGYKGLPQPRFSTLEELEKWADNELIKLEVRREEIRSKGYKYLKIEGKNGQVSYYQNLNFIFTKFEIRCKNFKGNISEIQEDKILNRSDVPEMKINIAR